MDCQSTTASGALKEDCVRAAERRRYWQGQERGHAYHPSDGTDALAELVVELTNEGLDAYFMQPLKLARPGFVVEQSAGLGMVGVRQLMGTVIRRVIGRMDGAQLLSVCGSIQQFMR